MTLIHRNACYSIFSFFKSFSNYEIYCQNLRRNRELNRVKNIFVNCCLNLLFNDKKQMNLLLLLKIWKWIEKIKKMKKNENDQINLQTKHHFVSYIDFKCFEFVIFETAYQLIWRHRKSCKICCEFDMLIIQNFFSFSFLFCFDRDFFFFFVSIEYFFWYSLLNRWNYRFLNHTISIHEIMMRVSIQRSNSNQHVFAIEFSDFSKFVIEFVDRTWSLRVIDFVVSFFVEIERFFFRVLDRIDLVVFFYSIHFVLKQIWCSEIWFLQWRQSWIFQWFFVSFLIVFRHLSKTMCEKM